MAADNVQPRAMRVRRPRSVRTQRCGMCLPVEEHDRPRGPGEWPPLMTTARGAQSDDAFAASRDRRISSCRLVHLLDPRGPPASATLGVSTAASGSSSRISAWTPASLRPSRRSPLVATMTGIDHQPIEAPVPHAIRHSRDDLGAREHACFGRVDADVVDHGVDLRRDDVRGHFVHRRHPNGVLCRDGGSSCWCRRHRARRRSWRSA